MFHFLSHIVVNYILLLLYFFKFYYIQVFYYFNAPIQIAPPFFQTMNANTPDVPFIQKCVNVLISQDYLAWSTENRFGGVVFLFGHLYALHFYIVLCSLFFF